MIRIKLKGLRLEDLSAIRLITRQDSENDPTLRKRVTNESTDRINLNDIKVKLENVPGVTFVNVYVNVEGEDDRYTLPHGTMVIAIKGGLLQDLAVALSELITPGVILHGNTSVVAELDGLRYENFVMRPADVPVSVVIQIRRHDNQLKSVPPSNFLCQ